MKKLVILLGAFALIGCGEKNESGASAAEAADSSADSQAAGNQTEESSADTAKPPPAESAVAESQSGEPSGTPNSLSDADVKRLLKEAVDYDSLEKRDRLIYQDNKPYSGWGKVMYDSGQVKALFQFKEGKADGLWTWWHKNGQKRSEGTYKDGKQDGLAMYWRENGKKKSEETYKDDKLNGLSTEWYKNGQKWGEGTYKDHRLDGLSTGWHENGQKRTEGIWKDGERLSGKYWNSKGEEVETESGSFK
jgi:antitoxin component YwqK of YwqJK toxin-antitoxin module